MQILKMVLSAGLMTFRCEIR